MGQWSWQYVQVLELIEDQLKRINQPLDALLLVGGFAGCEYLFKRVDVRRFVLSTAHHPISWRNLQAQFGERIKVIARPSDADTATARGAAQYGLARRPLVSSVIAPRAYIMKVKNNLRFRLRNW